MCLQKSVGRALNFYLIINCSSWALKTVWCIFVWNLQLFLIILMFYLLRNCIIYSSLQLQDASGQGT